MLQMKKMQANAEHAQLVKENTCIFPQQKL